MAIGKEDPTQDNWSCWKIKPKQGSRIEAKKFISKTIQEKEKKLKLHIERAHQVSKNTNPEWPTPKYILEKITEDEQVAMFIIRKLNFHLWQQELMPEENKMMY